MLWRFGHYDVLPWKQYSVKASQQLHFIPIHDFLHLSEIHVITNVIKPLSKTNESQQQECNCRCLYEAEQHNAVKHIVVNHTLYIRIKQGNWTLQMLFQHRKQSRRANFLCVHISVEDWATTIFLSSWFIHCGQFVISGNCAVPVVHNFCWKPKSTHQISI